MNFFEQFLISSFLGVLHSVIKNPSKAAALKTVLLEIRNDSSGLYPGE